MCVYVLVKNLNPEYSTNTWKECTWEQLQYVYYHPERN